MIEQYNVKTFNSKKILPSPRAGINSRLSRAKCGYFLLGCLAASQKIHRSVIRRINRVGGSPVIDNRKCPRCCVVPGEGVYSTLIEPPCEPTSWGRAALELPEFGHCIAAVALPNLRPTEAVDCAKKVLNIPLVWPAAAPLCSFRDDRNGLSGPSRYAFRFVRGF